MHRSILIFELKIWRVSNFFRRPPRWKISYVSEPTKIITVPRRPSTQLKKFFTRLKIAFHETAQEYFLSSKFDNVLSTFFVDHLDGKLAQFENLQNLKIIRGPRRPSTQLKKFFTRLKIAFHETAQEYFLSSNFDIVSTTFFVDHLDGKIAPSQDLLGLSNSLLDPHFIWKSPSLDWISLFMKMHKSILIFELKIWRVNNFFRRPAGWKIISVSEPTKIITVPRRPSTQLKKFFTRLKIAFHETAQEYFLSSKFDNVLSTFS